MPGHEQRAREQRTFRSRGLETGNVATPDHCKQLPRRHLRRKNLIKVSLTTQ